MKTPPVPSSEAAIRAIAVERRLPEIHLERWLALDEPSRASILSVVRKLRLRTAQIARCVEMLQEISLRESLTPAAILARDDLRRIVDGRGSAPGRARAMLGALEAIRFPRLKAALARLESEVAALKLPRGISVLLPPDLASDELTVALKPRTRAEFRELMAALENRRAGLERIVDLLGGKDEV